MRRSREEGVVLLLVLVVLVLLISSVYTFAQTSLLEIKSMEQRTKRVRAELLARSGVPIAMRALEDDRSLGEDPLVQQLESSLDAWRILSEQTIEVPGEGVLRIRVRDEGSRVNLNGLMDAAGAPHARTRGFLIAALEKIVEELPGRPEDKPYDVEELADALLDWLDADDDTRLGDPEAEHYRRAAGAGPPPNRPLWSLAELADVPGVDGPLLRGLEAHFRVYPLFPGRDEAGINPNTAPPHALALIYHGTTGDEHLLDPEDVFAILRAREEDRIFCPETREERCVSFESEIGRVGEPVFPPLSFRSEVFWIRSEARFDEARACFEAVVDRSELQTLSYRMDC